MEDNGFEKQVQSGSELYFSEPHDWDHAHHFIGCSYPLQLFYQDCINYPLNLERVLMKALLWHERFDIKIQQDQAASGGTVGMPGGPCGGRNSCHFCLMIIIGGYYTLPVCFMYYRSATTVA